MSSVSRGKQATAAAFGAFCPRFHRAIELVGRRWTGAIVRSLLDGRRRYSELVEAVPGISDRLLAARLRELESEGVVRRVVGTCTPVRVDYELTEAGTELEATIRMMGAWAERWIPENGRAGSTANRTSEKPSRRRR
jgi:DNA-binding HxlR family transcriptional regulator